MKLAFAVAAILYFFIFSGCESTAPGEEGIEMAKIKVDGPKFAVVKSEDEWREILTPAQFQILRKKGTEYAFTGKYHDNHDKGTYLCAGCQNELFHSDAKYDSGTGWPSFWKPVSENSILTQPDNKFFIIRNTEVICSRCGGHLGHVFDDGPEPTGLRYCINSLALDFEQGRKNPNQD